MLLETQFCLAQKPSQRKISVWVITQHKKKKLIPAIVVHTSGEDSGTCAAWVDLSEVLLDLDLMDDLLELFLTLVEASLPFAA